MNAVAGTTAAGDGRYDRSGGTDADCETIVGQFDVSGGTVNAGTARTTISIGTLPAGQKIKDQDGDGVLYDEVFFVTQQTQGLSAGTEASLLQVT